MKKKRFENCNHCGSENIDASSPWTVWCMDCGNSTEYTEEECGSCRDTGVMHNGEGPNGELMPCTYCNKGNDVIPVCDRCNGEQIIMVEGMEIPCFKCMDEHTEEIDMGDEE